MIPMIAAFAVLQRDDALEAKVNAALAKMTLEEKVEMLGGVDGFDIHRAPKAGLPQLHLSDGPVGVRNDGPTTAYPAGFTLAATWDTDLARGFGTAIGRDARARGVHVWLGPGVNPARIVQNGRNFEYMGEDPYLAGRIATEVVRGVQSQGVSATVKHFAGNEHENDRNNDDSQIDERTLRELYLKPFEMVVKDGKVGAVMTSYNLVNGVHASENRHLVTDILKGEWGFDGVVMSDWVSVYSVKAAYENGLDVEMPSGEHLNGTNLLPLLRSGKLSTAPLDDKVRRILRLAFRMGWDTRPQKDGTIALDDPANAAAAIQVAREGTVLLKNRDRVLPLSRAKQKILVVGPNADPAVTGGGGSAYTTPVRSVSVREAMTRLAPTGTVVSYRAGYASPERAMRETKFEGPLRAEYFRGTNLEGAPELTRDVDAVDLPPVSLTDYSIRFTGRYLPRESGEHTLIMRTDDGMRVFVDDKKVFDEWHDQAATTYTVPISLTAGKPIKVVVEYYQGKGDAMARFGIVRSIGADIEKELPSQEIRSADVIVACVGFAPSGAHYEGEGADRPWQLPAEQVAMLKRLVGLNKRVVVVLNAGAGVATQGWLEDAAGFVHAGYPGGEGNLALAEILYGRTSPSGKLPTSFPADLAETYYAAAYPPVDHKMVYREGPFIGYRWFDANAVAPLYPFGYGLSYSTFRVSGAKVRGVSPTTVSVNVQNTGRMRAAQTVQLYAEPPQGTVVRAPRELRAFARVDLAPGETRRVELSFDSRSLAYWDVAKRGWAVDPGVYKLRIGTSSRDLPLTVAIRIK